MNRDENQYIVLTPRKPPDPISVGTIQVMERPISSPTFKSVLLEKQPDLNNSYHEEEQMLDEPEIQDGDTINLSDQDKEIIYQP